MLRRIILRKLFEYIVLGYIVSLISAVVGTFTLYIGLLFGYNLYIDNSMTFLYFLLSLLLIICGISTALFGFDIIKVNSIKSDLLKRAYIILSSIGFLIGIFFYILFIFRVL